VKFFAEYVQSTQHSDLRSQSYESDADHGVALPLPFTQHSLWHS